MSLRARIETLGGRCDVPLAPRTTLELGGPAEYFAEPERDAALIGWLEFARDAGLPVAILGGGSNLIVPDEGVTGLVLAPSMRGVRVEDEGSSAIVTAGAGEAWDALVERTVVSDLAGLECLSGIPGSVGATPIQNVGAYGVEVADRLHAVEVYDRRSRAAARLLPTDLGLGYRDSALKRDPSRFVVLSVSFRLERGGRPTVRYAELERALSGGASLASVRETVIALRRSKSMVIDASDPNRRSAGSFFTNPIVSEADAARVFGTAVATGAVKAEGDVPRWSMPDGTVKLAAGFLIEKSGVEKGYREGAFGVSTKHALAVVHHGGGSVAELDTFAAGIREAVRSRFGVALEREPVTLSGSRDP